MQSDAIRKQFLLQMKQRTSRDGQALINLEQDTVSLVMKQFRVEKYLGKLRDIHQLRNGTRGLSVETFNQQADGFPFLLICSTLGGLKLHDDKHSTLPKMFASFDTTPLGKAYAKAEQMTKQMYGDDTRQPCLVVKRVNVRGGLAIYPSDSRLEDVPGLRLCFTPSDGSPLGPLTIEPLISLLERVKRVWTPQFSSTED